jgi:hypothetical protein
VYINGYEREKIEVEVPGRCRHDSQRSRHGTNPTDKQRKSAGRDVKK